MLKIRSLVQPAGAQGHDRLHIGSWATGSLLAVCDGAGGTSGAAGAAEAVIQYIGRVAPHANKSTRALLVDTLHAIDQSPPLASAGLTTALVAVVADGEIQGACVGDSEAWLVSNTDEIMLTENQNRKPLVGSGRCSAVPFGPVPMRGTLVLGSDGLFKYCRRERLLDIVRSPDLELIPELLLRASRLPSGRLQDDFAVIVCRDFA
ncbi:MAG: protein phosphatase 2C domain-containing protein [Myxococcales bacterium]